MGANEVLNSFSISFDKTSIK